MMNDPVQTVCFLTSHSCPFFSISIQLSNYFASGVRPSYLKLKRVELVRDEAGK